MAPCGPLPGSKLPSIELPLVSGGTVNLSALAPGSAAKLVVVYRGQFCPFCRVRVPQGSVRQRMPRLRAARRGAAVPSPPLTRLRRRRAR